MHVHLHEFLVQNIALRNRIQNHDADELRVAEAVFEAVAARAREEGRAEALRQMKDSSEAVTGGTRCSKRRRA